MTNAEFKAKAKMARHTFDLFKNGDREKLVVWIGKNGASVLPSVDQCAHAVTPAVAHHFIRKYRLRADPRPDGIIYSAGA